MAIADEIKKVENVAIKCRRSISDILREVVKARCNILLGKFRGNTLYIIIIDTYISIDVISIALNNFAIFEFFFILERRWQI